MNQGAHAASGTPIVARLTGLTKQFGTYVAVDQLSLAIHRGEILALLGQNGAGKTTTIRMLMGILAASSGSAEVCGYSCLQEREKVMALVGYLPDEPVFHDHLTGGEILRFWADLRGMSTAHAVQRGRALAHRLDLLEALDEFAINYSMGMKKKLALVCAMLHEPQLLILDEPTNGLDPYATRSLLEVVRESAGQGCAVFYSTHLLDQAERLCHRVGILNRGRLAALGTLEELRAQLGTGASLEDLFFQVGSPQVPPVEPGS